MVVAAYNWCVVLTKLFYSPVAFLLDSHSLPRGGGVSLFLTKGSRLLLPSSLDFTLLLKKTVMRGQPTARRTQDLITDSVKSMVHFSCKAV